MVESIVKIRWVDSKGPDGWEYLEDVKDFKPADCLTVGYEISNTEDSVTIVSTISGKQILGRLTIPKRCILNREILYGQTFSE